ncbi:MAG: tetratricopeptide repeat protein [Phycisphaerales bacterium]|nr:MAG: tetratricopeptide repeat protein [Phycisphaerales bacterium]
MMKSCSASPKDRRLVRFAAALGIVAITVLAYAPALRGEFIWDDDYYVTNNQTLRSADGLKAIWLEPRALPQYYPLVYTSFWVEYHLWELRPFGYHLTNVLLHAGSALLFWCLLHRLSVPGAYVAAVVFALHPVHVESVAWITERKNVLSGFFYLGAALAYLRFAGGGGSDPTPAIKASRECRRMWYSVAYLLFLCALFGKTVTCSLPAAILLILWWRFGRIGMRDVAALVPFFLTGAVMGLVTAWLEVHHVHAEGPQWDLSFLEKCLLAGRAVCFYLGKLLLPTHLCFIYPRWHIDAHVWWQYLFPMVLILAIVIFWFARHRIGKGPVVGLLFFVGTLFPGLGFFNVYPMRFSYVADHFQYHASLGVITIVVVSLHKVLGLLPARDRMSRGRDSLRGRPLFLSLAVWAVIPLALGVTTWRQAHNYRDLQTLWRATLAENSAAWLAYSNLGMVMVDMGRTDAALTLLTQALKLEPENAQLRLAFGFALLRAGRLEESHAELRNVVAMVPASAYGHALLGAVQARRSNIADAIQHYREALRLRPDLLQAREELAFMLLAKGYAEEAVREYEALLAYDPQDPEAMVYLGFALRACGRDNDAEYWITRALKLDPEVRRMNRRGIGAVNETAGGPP